MPAVNLRPFSTYLPPDIYDALVKIAAENGRTAAGEARLIIMRHVQNERPAEAGRSEGGERPGKGRSGVRLSAGPLGIVDR
jgi:hypothetical protein